tara:strand:- start:13254 stop:13739 length:486 start_codon:yes stop_codon:yes gene_type:complete
MNSVKISFLLFFFLISINVGYAQDIYDGNGLEVTEPIGIFVLVENLTDDAAEIGLNSRRIQDKIELRLQQADINIISRKEYLEGSYDYFLYANINVIGNAFSTSLQFQRNTFYIVGEKFYTKRAISWEISGSGTHGRDSEYIIDVIDRNMDSFINNFLKAN